ncbi:UDP-N-acetylmuramate--L-alanine ligase [candidate division WOR-3 bacterium]|jgi:UDP-N-acetylmuramate--alanine ligase|nr:UDP-N-acetylmuramate--L-alanine ligase [candidate division WOR-3 bacterium]
MFGRIKKIHFVGIGGIGMSGIAELLYNMGYIITGSDIKESENTKRLQELGIKVYSSHSKENLGDADVVVYTSALDLEENVELKEAFMRKIPVIPRAEMLAELMRMKFSIAVAGTHGKSTTASLIGSILTGSKFDPTIVLGGRLKSSGDNAKLGESEYLVAEADESDRSFLKLFPTIAVITNIDREHLDFYKDLDDIKQTFTKFANSVPFYGSVYLCMDDPNSLSIRSDIDKRVITFGLSPNADIKGLDIERKDFTYSFDLIGNGEKLGRINLSLPGVHNMINAVAACGVCLELGIGFDKIKEGIEACKGVSRRFERKGFENGILVIDDYAHHPSEIEATLKSAREGWKGRIIAVFQPHLYSRTILLKKEFGKAFFQADKVIITDIYPAREEEIPGVSGEIIKDQCKDFGHKDVIYLENIKNIPEYLLPELKEGDMILLLGAGNIYKIADDIIEGIRNKR